MIRILLLLLLTFSVTLFAQEKNKSIGFAENKGQIVDQKGKPNPNVKFLLNSRGLNVQLRKNGFSYDVYENRKVALTEADLRKRKNLNLDETEKNKLPDYSLETVNHRVDIDFEGSNAGVVLEGSGKSKDYNNYYTVKHAPEGVLMVHKFDKVTYKNLYPNVDVVFFVPVDSTKVVEYNFIVRPGGKVGDIKMKFNGVKTHLEDSKIKMETRFGIMEETLPLSWTEAGGDRNEVAIGYKKIRKNVYGFDFDESQVIGKTVVIDPVPVRLWGTYYGNEIDVHYTMGIANITTDNNGNSYMSGSTTASNSSYATAGAHQSFNPNVTTFNSKGIIVKFDANGNRLWGTYYGGDGLSPIKDIKADSQNNIFICGWTQSVANISTAGSHKPSLSGYTDAYLVKFNDSGMRIWGTYYGGTEDESALGLAIDDVDNIYIVGNTSSTSEIAVNCNFKPQLTVGPLYSVDGFVAKFNGSGNILWSTYAGGESNDGFTAVAVRDNQVLVGGYTLSFTNISTSGVFMESHNPITHFDGMVYKFNSSGFRLWSTYYGGEQVDYIYTVELDDEGNAYLGGETASVVNMATPESFESAAGLWPYNGFFAKLNSNGQRLWGSYMLDGFIRSIVYKNNSIYLGVTNGIMTHPNWTNPCSYRTSSFFEGYIGKFTKLGTFVWGSFIGGNISSSLDNSIEIAINQNNDIYICGQTSNSNTGVTDANSYQTSILGTFNNYFMMKFHEGDLCSMEFQPTSNSPICASQTISFNDIPSGYVYSWTGPNGFTSTIQNPTITNANATNNGLYTLVINDGTACSCEKTYTFSIVVEDNLSPVPTVSGLPMITGGCTTIITSIPTALDNCAGTITATTLSPLSYSIPGNYTIMWNYADGNGNSYSQTQNVVIVPTAIPIVNQNFYYCLGSNPIISDVIITGQNIKWYDALNGALLADTTLLIDGVTYYVSQTINGCESTRIPVMVNAQSTPAPSGIAVQTFCDTQVLTLADFVVSGTDLKFYDGNIGGNLLPTSTTLVDGVTYYASQTLNGCESISRLALTPDIISGIPANGYAELMCDDLGDGVENVDLSDYNGNLIANASAYTFNYYTSFTAAENEGISITGFSNYTLNTGLSTIYVRVEFANSCYEVVALELTVVALPKLNMKDSYSVCENGFITITADAAFDSYSWSTGATSQAIVVTNGGNYEVTVTKNTNGLICSSTKNITVEVSQKATITAVETVDWTSNDNVITVYVDGSGVYEYSVDGVNFQSSNQFFGLPNGEYTVYVNDTKGCGVAKKDVYLLMYPKYFTPNGDSYNDFWGIQFYQNEMNLVVKIFDRYGKFIKQLNAKDPVWDGTYQGNNLPATDYWFTVIREDGTEYKGHFTLKR